MIADCQFAVCNVTFLLYKLGQQRIQLSSSKSFFSSWIHLFCQQKKKKSKQRWDSFSSPPLKCTTILSVKRRIKGNNDLKDTFRSNHWHSLFPVMHRYGVWGLIHYPGCLSFHKKIKCSHHKDIYIPPSVIYTLLSMLHYFIKEWERKLFLCMCMQQKCFIFHLFGGFPPSWLPLLQSSLFIVTVPSYQPFH